MAAHAEEFSAFPMTWGISVRVSELGSALQGFAKSLPSCNAFRLSHRFGQGPKAYLNRLPQELVETIAEEIIHTEVHAARPVWEEELQCFEGGCSRESHTTEALADDAHNLVWGSVSDDESICSDMLDAETDVMVERLITDDHHMNVAFWKSRLLQLISTATDEAPKSYEFEVWNNMFKLLYTHFGLRPRISHQVGCPEVDCALGYQTRSTTCYLIVPAGPSKGAPGSKETYHMPATVDPSTLQLSNDITVRFNRAMNVLDLKPYVHPVQVEIKSSHPSYKKQFKANCVHQFKVRDLEKHLLKTAQACSDSKWPKLTICLPEPRSYPITSCTCSNCEMDDDSEEEDMDWDLHTPAFAKGRKLLIKEAEKRHGNSKVKA